VSDPPGPIEAADFHFDVERFRRLERRSVVVQRIGAPALVLGSRQSPDLVDLERARAAGVAVVRRRSGGGAVLVGPQDPIWLDVWLPATDPLWRDDVGRATEWVGRWWASVLAALGGRDLRVHQGPPICSRWSDWVCFAGVGSGEVSAGSAKVVGIAQWRSRQGSLFHVAAYRRWDPSLVDLFDLPLDVRTAMRAELAGVATGVDDVVRAPLGYDALVEALVDHLPDAPGWEVSTGH
jgi:lipoate-protein ligase A